MGPRGPTVRSVSEKDKVNVIPDSCQASSGAVVASLGAWRTEDIPGKHAFFQTRQSFDSNTWMASTLAERAVSYVSLFCPFYFRARGGPGNFFFFFFARLENLPKIIAPIWNRTSPPACLPSPNPTLFPLHLHFVLEA